jgi:hypothetical protein
LSEAGARVSVTQDELRAALEAWHAQFLSHPEALRAQLFVEIEKNRSEIYARQQAPGFFKLLQQHGRPL